MCNLINTVNISYNIIINVNQDKYYLTDTNIIVIP